jgi:hypothetical protein
MLRLLNRKKGADAAAEHLVAAAGGALGSGYGKVGPGAAAGAAGSVDVAGSAVDVEAEAVAAAVVDELSAAAGEDLFEVDTTGAGGSEEDA